MLTFSTPTVNPLFIPLQIHQMHYQNDATPMNVVVTAVNISNTVSNSNYLLGLHYAVGK